MYLYCEFKNRRWSLTKKLIRTFKITCISINSLEDLYIFISMNFFLSIVTIVLGFLFVMEGYL